jgi:predicted phosphodiesterase
MKILDVEIKCNSRGDRVEIFPFYDMHIGKANSNEEAIKKQVQEIILRDAKKDRHILVVLGGDAVNAISASDRKRFDFSDIADWVASGTPQDIKEALSDLPKREIRRVKKILSPIKHLIIGAIEGNHEKSLRKFHDIDVQAELCETLGCENLTDECLLRLKFERCKQTTTAVIYMRHGYGSGRAPGAEPTKLQTMLSEWECADVCLSGHTHTFCVLPPKPVAIIKGTPNNRTLSWKHRFAANPGCWLETHSTGRGSYESQSCYPARAFMTCKIVIWPFYGLYEKGREFTSPKIEVRSYPIL